MQLEANVKKTAPLADVFEGKTDFLIVLDVPGATADALAINVDNDELSIEAKRPGEERSALAAEYAPRDYLRRFVLPKGIDAQKIDASLKDGVLTLRLPKEEKLLPRRIQVKAG